MDPTDFDNKVLSPLGDKPQLEGLAKYHLANLHAAIKGLHDMGYRVALDFAPEPPPLEFPKMLYSDDMPYEIVVENSDEASKAMENGYRATPKPVVHEGHA